MQQVILICVNQKNLQIELQSNTSKLKDVGFLVAHSPEEAISLVKNFEINMAVVDYEFADTANGLIIKLLSKMNVPSIVITDQISDKVRSSILKNNVIDYFQLTSHNLVKNLIRTIDRIKNNSRFKILVVDDSKLARLKVTSLLKRHNYKVLEAEDGEQALSILKNTNDIKVIITDNQMPGIEGAELVNRIRTNHPKDDLAIIGLSSQGGSMISAKFLKNGANDFLVKPFCQEEFYCRLNHNIDALEYVAQIKLAANTDYLTKLFNRRYLSEAIFSNSKYMSSNLNLAIVDIDHFKRINDAFGHDVGDLALIQLANTMKSIFDTEMCSRFGGEEFCIASYESNTSEFIEKLERLRATVQNNKLKVDDRLINFTVSIGFSVSNSDLNSLIIDADSLLYKAKKSGRNKLITS